MLILNTVLKTCSEITVEASDLQLLNQIKEYSFFKKYSDHKGGVAPYKESLENINKTFGLETESNAVNKLLKRNFKSKLKVARITTSINMITLRLY